MKAESTIRAELRQVRLRLQDPRISETARSEQYGAQQALEWALGHNATRPSLLRGDPQEGSGSDRSGSE